MNESALKVIADLYPKYGIDMWRHVQKYRGSRLGWHSINPYEDWDVTRCDVQYRVIHHVHRVNGIECPAPMSEEPTVEGEYWCVTPDARCCVCEFWWSGDAIDKWRLKTGIFHTREDALANFYAHYPHMRPEAE